MGWIFWKIVPQCEDAGRRVAGREDDGDRLGRLDRKSQILRSLDVHVDPERRMTGFRLLELD
jgi:hypothetical protein